MTNDFALRAVKHRLRLMTGVSPSFVIRHLSFFSFGTE